MLSTRCFPLVLLLFVAVGLVGCGSNSPASGNGENNSDEPNNTNENNAVNPISVSYVDPDEFKQLLKDSQGKVTVVDLWATDCGPCVAELPGLAKLNKKLEGKINAITVSLDFYGDDREDVKKLVQKKLEELEMSVTNVIMGDPDYDIQAEHQMFIPVVLVYDEEGKLARGFHNGDNEFEDGFNYERDVIPFVEKLVAGE